MEPLFGRKAFVLHEKEEHAAGRRAIMPALHNKTVDNQIDMITEIITSQLASWPVGAAAPLSPHIYRLTLTVILRAMISNRQQLCEELCRHILDMLTIMSSPLLQVPQLRHLPGWRRAWKSFIRKREEVDALIFGLITQRRNECDHTGDLLDLLLTACGQDGSPASDRRIRDNLMSVIIAGHETTAATLAWTFQLLAHNPTVQDRLVEELDDHRSGSYMHAVIQEALRHKPTFLFLPPRVVVKPTRVGGWDYPPPTQLLACTYLMHHDPLLFPDPHVFLPERFMVETPTLGTPLPWGAGRKRCPGRHLALMEIQTVLRQALSVWNVQPASRRIEHPQWRTALLTPANGSRAILSDRSQAIQRKRLFES